MQLGMALGFDDRTADVRVAQYESGTRTPKEKYVVALAEALHVEPATLTIPDIESYDGLLHTFFALEDLYGLKINTLDGEVCLSLEKYDNPSFHTLFDMLCAWRRQAEKLKNGEITKAEYDDWRYNYPASAASNNREPNG